MSPRSAGLAVQMGYKNVRVYLQGNPGWEESGRALVASDAFVMDGNIILVDLRDPKEVRRGHIPKAVNIPFKALEDAWDAFPENRAAPIVVYGKTEEANKAVATLKEWGYRKVAQVEGGIERWAKVGRPVAKGEGATKIAWVRKPDEGEISAEEFAKILNERSADKLVLDVRGPEEVAAGAFAGAVNIPLDQLDARIGEIPKGKEVLVHCATGARAEMARQVLAKAGVPSRFLVADVHCKEGVCRLAD